MNLFICLFSAFYVSRDFLLLTTVSPVPKTIPDTELELTAPSAGNNAQ